MPRSDHLAEVRSAAEVARMTALKTSLDLTNAMRDADRAGVPRREIAEAAKLSPSRVSQILGAKVPA